ncbi:hypothetical protein L3i20_v209310 [Paenibacillus sp. L3-i20]|nr:hypothetical protein L3i20_v209310 [Paenibacillus sp. L3-i20]
MVPVDPAEAYLNLSKTAVSEEALQAARVELGLDQPLVVQYLQWLGDALRLDFGISYVSKKPVVEEILSYLPATLQLAAGAIVLLIVISIPIGILSALYKDRWFDHISRLFVFAVSAMRSFWLGFLLVYFFSMKLNVLPLMGRGGITHLILPALTLALAYCSSFIRLLRTGILNYLKSPFVLYARLRGIKESRVIGTHVLRNALPPVTTA